MTERYRLTEKLIKAADLKSTKYHLFDSDLLGFSAVVHPSGLRAFCLHYWVQGRQRKFTIGRWPEWSVVAARERAKVLRREIDAGDDPMARREAQRAAPRIPDLINLYIEQHLPRLSPRNASDQVSMLRNLVEPEWKTRLVADITPDDVARLLTKIAEGRPRPAKEKAKSRGRRTLQGPKPTPIRANRTGEVLRKMFNLSVRPWKMRDDNPAEGFLRRAETERDRFLSLEEVDRLANALAAAEDQRAATLVRMCMLTGARLGEVRLARFEQFDLNLCIWTKQAATTKQRKVHRVPISEDVATIVRLRRAAAPADCPWLFPGEVDGQPLQDIRRFWKAIQTAAELTDVRLHDLRHTFASMLAGRGASLAMIGKLLGHTQAKTTQRYAHLADQPLRTGVDEVAALMRPKPRIVVRN
jgi:integrase